MANTKPSRIRAIATDSHLWLPVIVLLIGIGMLVLLK